MLKNIKCVLLFSIVIFLACSFSFAENNIDSQTTLNSLTILNQNINVKNTTDMPNNDIKDLNVKTSSYKTKAPITSSSPSNSQKILAAGDNAPVNLSQSSIIASANTIQPYVYKYGKLPNYIKIENYKFSMPEFLYLLSKTINQKYLGSSSKINIKYNVKTPKSPNGNSVNTKIYKKTYYSSANSVINFINKYGTAPNYASCSFNKIQYQTLIYGFSLILSYNYKYKKLPSYLALNVKITSPLNKYKPVYNRSSESNNESAGDENSSTSYPSKLSQSSILAASSTVKTYVESNGKLPEYVTISSKKYSIPEFMYLLSKAIVYKNTNSTSDITVKININNPNNPSGSSINATMTKDYYSNISNRIASFIEKNNMAPNYVTSIYGNIQYQTIIYGLAKVGNYFNQNKILPNYLGLNIKNSNSMNKKVPYYYRSIA